MEARGKAAGSLTGLAVDRVGALTGSGQNPGRPLTGSGQNLGRALTGSGQKSESAVDRVESLTGHDDVSTR